MEIDTEFRFDGGATWLNLLATQGQSFGARPIERLTTPDAGDRWLTHVGYPLRKAMTTGDLDDLVQLREALRELAMAAVDGRKLAPDTVAHLHAVASTRSDLPFPSPAEQGVSLEAALRVIAIQALVTVQGPDRELLKECAEKDCRWVFLDTSGRRHWCPSPACASRGRVRAHRSRQSTHNEPQNNAAP